MNRTAFVLTALAFGLLSFTGCDEDERAQVNRSQAQVAEASRQLVEADAKARTETIAMQRDLQKGQEQLENDRRQYADQRNRDPIIANTILDVGMILACLLPLALCILVVLSLRDKSQTDTDLADVLVQEIVSDCPNLLPPSDTRRAMTKDRSRRSVARQLGIPSKPEPSW